MSRRESSIPMSARSLSDKSGRFSCGDSTPAASLTVLQIALNLIVRSKVSGIYRILLIVRDRHYLTKSLNGLCSTIFVRLNCFEPLHIRLSAGFVLSSKNLSKLVIV